MATLKLAPRDSAVTLTWVIRLAIVALTLWAGLGAPSRPLLEALLPAQTLVYQTLMPEHRLLKIDLRQQGAQLSLAVHSQTARYIVVRGKAYPPGVDFEASTPARSALLVAMVVVIGGALVTRGQAAAMLGRAALCLVAAVLLAIVIPAVVLAGAQWGVAYGAFEELSAPTMLVGASDFLLHGGGLAIGAAIVWCLRTPPGSLPG